MTVSSVSQTTEVGASSYLQQTQNFTNENMVSDNFRVKFLETIFSEKQDIVGSIGQKIVREQNLTSSSYEAEKSKFASDSAKVDEDMGQQSVNMLRTLIQLREQNNMNMLVSGVTKRFGNSINQLVRGQ